MWRRLLWCLSILVLLVVSAGLLFVAFFDFDDAIETQKNEYLPQLTALLGREVTAGPVAATFWPHLGGTLHDIRVAGPTKDAPPLLRIDRLHLAIDSKEGLFSWGDTVRVVALTLTDVEFNLTRLTDGTYAHEDVLARIRARQRANQNTTLDPKGERFVRELRLDTLALNHGRVIVHGSEGPPEARTPLSDVHLRLSDVARGRPYDVALDAAVGGQRKNLSLKGRMGPTTMTKSGRFTPIHTLTFALDQLHMGGITPYLGETRWRWGQTTLDGDWTLEDPHGLTPHTRVKGAVTMRGVLSPDRDDETPFDVNLRADVEVDRTVGRVRVTDTAIGLADMTVRAAGEVSGMYSTTPHVEAVSIETQNMEWARLLAYLPGLSAHLPIGSALSGPFALSVHARMMENKPTVSARLRLDDSALNVPGILRKTIGVPLGLGLNLTFGGEGTRVQIQQLAWADLTLAFEGPVDADGAMRLAGSLTVGGAHSGGERQNPMAPIPLTLSGPFAAPRLTGPGVRILLDQLPTRGGGHQLIAALGALIATPPARPTPPAGPALTP